MDIDLPGTKIDPATRRMMTFQISIETPLIGALTIILWAVIALRLYATRPPKTSTRQYKTETEGSTRWNIAVIVLIVLTGIFATIYVAIRAAVTVLNREVWDFAFVRRNGEVVIADPDGYTMEQRQLLLKNLIADTPLIYAGRLFIILAQWTAKLSYVGIFMKSAYCLPKVSRWFLYVVGMVTVVSFVVCIWAVTFDPVLEVFFVDFHWKDVM